MTKSRSLSNQVGREAGVDYRELAREMGLSAPWRRWTDDAFIEACSTLCGLEAPRHLGIHAVYLSGRRVEIVTEQRGIMLAVMPRIRTTMCYEARVDTWALVSQGKSRPRRREVASAERVPVARAYAGAGVVGWKAYSGVVVVLCNGAIEAFTGEACLPLAALSSRLLLEGTVAVEQP